MPKVGSKHFSYGPKGMQKAHEEAMKTGKPMQKMPMKPAKKGKK